MCDYKNVAIHKQSSPKMRNTRRSDESTSVRNNVVTLLTVSSPLSARNNPPRRLRASMLLVATCQHPESSDPNMQKQNLQPQEKKKTKRGDICSSLRPNVVTGDIKPNIYLTTAIPSFRASLTSELINFVLNCNVIANLND